MPSPEHSQRWEQKEGKMLIDIYSYPVKDVLGLLLLDMTTGDNLLIARINVLNTLVDYMKDRWNETPTDRLLMKYAQTIAWNFWQMDGLKGTVPNTDIECRIMDWKKGEALTFNSVKRKDEQI